MSAERKSMLIWCFMLPAFTMNCTSSHHKCIWGVFYGIIYFGFRSIDWQSSFQEHFKRIVFASVTSLWKYGLIGYLLLWYMYRMNFNILFQPPYNFISASLCQQSAWYGTWSVVRRRSVSQLFLKSIVTLKFSIFFFFLQILFVLFIYLLYFFFWGGH